MKRVLKTNLLNSGEYECLFDHIGLLERASCREYGTTGNYASKYIASLMQFSKSNEWEVWEHTYKELEKHLNEAKGWCFEPLYKMACEELEKLRKEVQHFEDLMDEDELKEELEKNRRKNK